MPDTNKVNILFFDIEATNLKADYGYMLCVSWKWADAKKVEHLSITQSPTFAKDHTCDKWLVEEFRKILEKADIIIGHYSTRFDYPYLQTRALYHKLKPLPNPNHIDTWRVARKTLALHSNRLASLAAVMGVEEKTPLSGPIWIKAMAGHPPSIKYVVEHCDQDVVVLEQVYNKLKALRRDGPKVSVVGCPSCGSSKVQKRGIYKTVKKAMHRYNCQSCGRWWNQ